jgi:excisionase family DNA binding protein
MKRTEITVETHRVQVIRRSGRVERAWCEACAGEVRMVTPEEAAAVTGVSTRTIYRRVEDNQLHFTETPEGRLRVCFKSMANANLLETPSKQRPV